MPKIVTTIDDTLQIFVERDLHSKILSQIPKGAYVEIGGSSTVDGREWMRATLNDGVSGYALAPSVRGHTTFIPEGAVSVESAAVAGIDNNRQPKQLVFRPMASIQWPKRCVKCFSPNPTRSVMLGVKDASNTAKAVGWIAGGAIMHKAVEALAVGLHGEVQQYTVPTCASCKRLLSRHDVTELASFSGEAFTQILSRRIDEGCVVLTFNNTAYDAAFRSVNAGHIFNSVDDCLGVRRSLAEEGGAATAPNVSKVKGAKQVPCPGCTRSISNGALVCPYCGHTQWGRIVSYFFVGLALLGIGYEFCGPGFWRWVWWIIGAFFALGSFGEAVKSIRRRRLRKSPPVPGE